MKTDRFVFRLDEIRLSDLRLVGGKGATLGELCHFRLPVPQGFCVTTAAYERAAEKARRQRRGRNGKPPLSMPAEVETAVRGALDDLLSRSRRHCGVAVRSSALVEDSALASFAGQFVSFLNVKGPTRVIQRIADCWASLANARVSEYMRRRKISQIGTMGVLVQELIPGMVSGVLLTADPRTRNRDRFIVESGWGLCDTVVCAMQTPDLFVLDVAGGNVSIESKKVYKEGLMSRCREDRRGGVERKVLPDSLKRRQALSMKELKELVRLGRLITDHLGGPQDIEWTAMRGQIYILQSRPITSGGRE